MLANVESMGKAPRSSPPISGKRVSGMLDEAPKDPASSRHPRRSIRDSARAKTPPSPRQSLSEALPPLTNNTISSSRKSLAMERAHEELKEVLGKQRDAVAREGVDAYVSARVASGRSSTTSPSALSKNASPRAEEAGTRRSDTLSARRFQAKGASPQDISLTKGKGDDSSLDLDDSDLGDLGDLDGLLASAPTSARKTPTAHGSPTASNEDDVTRLASRMLAGAFSSSPRQQPVSARSAKLGNKGPTAASPRPADPSLSSFPDSASTWGTLASAGPSPTSSARPPQSAHLPNLTPEPSNKIPHAVPAPASSRKPQPVVAAQPASAKEAAHPPSGRKPTATSARKTAPAPPEPPLSEKAHDKKSARENQREPSARKNVAVVSSAKETSHTDTLPPIVPHHATIDSTSPNKDSVFSSTVEPKNVLHSPRAPTETHPTTSGRGSASTPRKSASKGEKETAPVVVTSARKKSTVAVPVAKPPAKGVPAKKTVAEPPAAKGAKKATTTTKQAPTAPTGSKVKSRQPSVADIVRKASVLEKKGSRASMSSNDAPSPAKKTGAGGSGVTGAACLADLLWGDALYAAETTNVPVAATVSDDDALPPSFIYPIPYLRKIEEIRHRVRVSNEQGKFTDDELKRVQGWEVIGDDLKEVLARGIEELVAKELSHRESGHTDTKHKICLWDAPSKKPFRASRVSVTTAAAAAPPAKGKPAKAPPPSTPSASTSGPADSLVGKLADDFTSNGFDVRFLRLSEKAVKMESVEVAAIIAAQGPSPYFRKDPLLIPTKSVAEDDEKFGTVVRSLASFDTDTLPGENRKSITGALSDPKSQDEAEEYFKTQFYELTVVGDGKKGNLRLVKAILQATILGMVEASGATALSLRECCEEHGVVASSISDGSMEFIPELLLQYALLDKEGDCDDEDDDGDESFSLDMYDVFTSAMFQQQYRIPLVEILMDVLAIPRHGAARTTEQPPQLKHQNKLFRELTKIKGELLESWVEFFHDVCDAKKAIPRELRGRRLHLVRKMIGLPDVDTVASRNPPVSGAPVAAAATAAQIWLNRWSPSSTSSVLALRAILKGSDAAPDIGPYTGKALVTATTRFWKFMLKATSSDENAKPIEGAAPAFAFGVWDLAPWKVHGDGYDVVSRAARDNDVDLLCTLQEGFERLPPSWAVDILLPSVSQAVVRHYGTVTDAAATDGDGEDAVVDTWPLELYVGVRYDEDALEDIRNDIAGAEGTSVPPVSLATYYREIFLMPNVAPLEPLRPFVASSRKGPGSDEFQLATLFDQLLLRRGRDDMTPLFTAAMSNAAAAVSFILETLDHLPHHTTSSMTRERKKSAPTRWLAEEMVRLPCQIDGLGSALDMAKALEKDEAVINALYHYDSADA